MLFGGAVPPNGFMVQVEAGGPIWINDNGPAGIGYGNGPPPLSNNPGFVITTGGAPPTFITPSGYKPMGPVSVNCNAPGSTLYVAARAW
jgi:hypothetical protein